MRHGVCAEEGLWVVAVSHLSKTAKGVAQATEINLTMRWATRLLAERPKLFTVATVKSTGCCFSSGEITDNL